MGPNMLWLTEWLVTEMNLQPGMRVLDMGCGRIMSGLERVSDTDWTKLCRKAKQHGGHLLLEKAPEEFKQRHDVFGPQRSGWHVMHRVKNELDPHRLFAPGRLPGKV